MTFFARMTAIYCKEFIIVFLDFFVCEIVMESQCKILLFCAAVSRS